MRVHFLVTGCAGFIASHLVDRLLAAGHQVTGYDNLSTGQPEFLAEAKQSPRFQFVYGDVLDSTRLTEAMVGADLVFHLAANADVRYGTQHPTKDLEQNTIATGHVLEAMRRTNVRRIAFASTGSVYGESPIIPTPEDAPFPIQTSLYGASKLAAEGLIEAYSEGFGFRGFIFRFVSILGERYTHGHVLDFYRQLTEHPDRLTILGNGKQRKSYLYVQDCVSAMLLAIERAPNSINIFNLGTQEACLVDESVGWICNSLGLTPRRDYAGGDRGWIGDNPIIVLDCSRIRALGWEPELTIREAVIRTVQYLQQNPWIFERRN